MSVDFTDAERGAEHSHEPPAQRERVRPRHLMVVQHEENAGIGRFKGSLVGPGLDTEVVGPGVGVAIPEKLGEVDGLVVLGGSPGPNDDGPAPWLPGVRALIREALNRELPYLGICLGGQMLAVVAGGTVGPVQVRPELGLGSIETTEAGIADPLIGSLPRSTRSVQWHYEEITQLPAGSEALMRSETSPNQAFRVGRNAWGLQFHPEANADTAKKWSIGEDAELAELGLTAESVVDAVAEADPELDATWIPMFRRWVAQL